MYTDNYDFTSLNVIKIIVKNEEGKILLIQEPENNKWMPLHWGLPGGKPTERESLMETFERKAKTDVGQKLKFGGILKIEELLMKKRTVMMYIVLAEATSDEVNGEAKKYKWIDKKEIKKMKTSDFTEFYNKKLLMDFFENKLKSISSSVIETWNYYKMGNEKEYEEWFKSGS